MDNRRCKNPKCRRVIKKIIDIRIKSLAIERITKHIDRLMKITIIEKINRHANEVGEKSIPIIGNGIAQIINTIPSKIEKNNAIETRPKKGLKRPRPPLLRSVSAAQSVGIPQHHRCGPITLGLLGYAIVLAAFINQSYRFKIEIIFYG